MKYWGNSAAFGAAGGQTTAYLLEQADGRCGAWADFLVDCTKAQSLSTVKKVSILAYPFVGTFTSGGNNFFGFCGVPAPGVPGNGIFIKALPGQSNQTPPRNFVDHAVVAWAPNFPAAVPPTPPPAGTDPFVHFGNLYNNAQQDVQIHIYDPSYGTKILGTRAYETAALDWKTYAVQGPNGWLTQQINEDGAQQDFSFYNN